MQATNYLKSAKIARRTLVFILIFLCFYPGIYSWLGYSATINQEFITYLSEFRSTDLWPINMSGDDVFFVESLIAHQCFIIILIFNFICLFFRYNSNDIESKRALKRFNQLEITYQTISLLCLLVAYYLIINNIFRKGDISNIMTYPSIQGLSLFLVVVIITFWLDLKSQIESKHVLGNHSKALLFKTKPSIWHKLTITIPFYWLLSFSCIISIYHPDVVDLIINKLRSVSNSISKMEPVILTNKEKDKLIKRGIKIDAFFTYSSPPEMVPIILTSDTKAEFIKRGIEINTLSNIALAKESATAINQGNNHLLLYLLNRMRDSNLSLPKSYFFIYAKALFEQKMYKEAKLYAQYYLEQSSDNAPYVIEAKQMANYQ